MDHNHRPFVTVYKPIAGWKAVLITWDEELDEYIPWQTGYFGYDDKAMAIADAKSWADAEEIEYREG